jgi:hypothetical protein
MQLEKFGGRGESEALNYKDRKEVINMQRVDMTNKEAG